MLFQKLRSIFFKSPIGLLPDKPDDRDIEVGLLWGLFTKYEPKHDSKVLPARDPKNQFCNTCGWNAATGMKEIDENEDLDERSLVMFGRERGLISGDGFSRLRDNQAVLLKDGIAPKGMLQDDRSSWENYSNPKHLTAKIREEAAKRKIQSYAIVGSIDEVYKATDEGRPVEIGIDWYTGWNMSGGFKLPWIVYTLIGYLVGGHALYVRGYHQNYKGQKVFVVRNSYGKSYADKGDFYITPERLAPNISKYGAFINYDLPVDVARWIQNHQRAVVKTKDSPDVYLIEGETKRRFPDEATLLVHGYMIENIVNVDPQFLNMVKPGKDMEFWEGVHVKATKEILRIAKDKKLDPVFKKYFIELL